MASQQLTEPGNLPPEPGFTDTTLRQVVRLTQGGRQIRVRFSNEFGNEPLTLAGARVAKPKSLGAIDPRTEKELTFGGRESVTISPGAAAVSDPCKMDVAPLSDLAVTLHIRTTARQITGHPGARCTSFLAAGNAVSAPDMTGSVPVEHWYFLSGIEIPRSGGAGAIVALGDSITDGRGSPTNGNGRWPDYLARRLQANRDTRSVAVLNAGIGGNCVTQGGLGPPAVKRLERDVLGQPGVRWLIVFEGINDLGGRAAGASELIAAYKTIIAQAKARGLRVYGGTILPCGESFYFTPELEAARVEINRWIRTGGAFDAVIDFDAALRDPRNLSQLSEAALSPDHLHPSGLGYKALTDAIDLKLFI